MSRFTDNEMAPDPPTPKPVCTFTEVADDPTMRAMPTEAVSAASRASEWFKKSRVDRVPMIALESDVYQVQGQSWACFSVIRPDQYRALHHNNKQYHGNLIKFRGAFATREAAEAHIRRLMAADKHFDVHLVPGFTWSGIDDDAVEDREYADSMIGDIMKGYFENENSRMMSLRSRIASTESVVGDDGAMARNLEATAFFDKCGVSASPALLAAATPRPMPRVGPDGKFAPEEEDGPVSVPAIADHTSSAPQAWTMDELVKAMEIHPAPVVRASAAGGMGAARARAIVSEVLVNSEEDTGV
jgi:hypothetical protein